MNKKSNSLRVVTVVSTWVVFGVINLVSWRLGGEHPVQSWAGCSLLTIFLTFFTEYLISRPEVEKRKKKKKSYFGLLLVIIAMWAYVGVIYLGPWRFGDEHPVKHWIDSSIVLTIVTFYFFFDYNRSVVEEQLNDL